MGKLKNQFQFKLLESRTPEESEMKKRKRKKKPTPPCRSLFNWKVISSGYSNGSEGRLQNKVDELKGAEGGGVMGSEWGGG